MMFIKPVPDSFYIRSFLPPMPIYIETHLIIFIFIYRNIFEFFPKLLNFSIVCVIFATMPTIITIKQIAHSIFQHL